MVGLLLLITLAQNAFNLKFLRPNTSGQTLILVALSALIFLLLIALSLVLLRNLMRLFAERRIGKPGSQFRTRMVLGALALSFVPVIFLFAFAYLLMNRSIDKWFSHPVEELRTESGQVASLLSSYARENAEAEAREIAALPQTAAAYQSGNFSPLVNEMRLRQNTLEGGFALALQDGDLAAGFNAPQSWGDLRSNIPALSHLDEHFDPAFSLNGRDFVLGAARSGPKGWIVVAMPLPAGLQGAIAQISSSEQRYYELSNQRRQVRRTYMGLLLLLTVLVLFFATWFALFLSKLVTRPVEALAEATQEISRGRYDYRIEIAAADELGALVGSFNRMAAELGSAQQAMQESSRQLSTANAELEQRRRQMETILESIPTGVLSLAADQRVARANPALRRIFAPRGGGAHDHFPVGASLREVFTAEVAADLDAMMRKADRMGSVTSQLEIQGRSGRLTVAVTVASLHHAQQRMGWVMVFDDLSDLLKANKQAAWQEVARRVAHEIKNPLTPIALSAERIIRHVERAVERNAERNAERNPEGHADPASLRVIRECAVTVASAVETVRSLVNEFSAMARFPAAQPQPTDANALVQEALAMFNGRLDGITVQAAFAPNLPPVLADPRAIERAIANIVDNAAEAMQQSLLREVNISTALLAGGNMVEIVIADSGPGVSQEVKEKLFFPYFSTKRRGTGLGLAIVGRIIEEHHGSVRVEENSPVGARFILELPVASEARRSGRMAHQSA